MAADDLMKCYKGIFEAETFRCFVATDPVCGNAEVGTAVAVRPHVSCERNLADGVLVFQVS
jgi:hypothetical protein